jgi:hypothetical protein
MSQRGRLIRASFSAVFVVGVVVASAPVARADAVTGVVQFGTPLDDRATSIALGGSPARTHLYVGGWTDGRLGGSRLAGRDAFLGRFDRTSSLVWIRQFGTDGRDEATSVAVGDRAVYVGGTTTGALGGDRRGGEDGFVRRYAPDGTHEWTRILGTRRDDVVLGIAADEEGVYAAGATRGGLSAPSAGGWDAFLRRYDRTGRLVWERQFGTSEADSGTATTVFAGGVAVAGETGGALPGTSSKGGTDAFLRVYSSDGVPSWTRQIGTSEADRGTTVQALGGVRLGGTTAGSLPGQSSAGGVDGFFRTFGSDGGAVFTDQFGSGGNDMVTTLSLGFGIQVAGSTDGTFPGQAGEGGLDLFSRNVDDSTGDELWTEQSGTGGNDRVLGGAGLLYDVGWIVGSTDGAFPGYENAGGEDVLLALVQPGDWQDARAMELLTRALAAAQTYYADNGDSYADFTAIHGALIDPELTWQADVPDDPQVVSVRDVGATHLLLTTLSNSGRYFCIVGDAGSTGAQGAGDTPIESVSECGA